MKAKQGKGGEGSWRNTEASRRAALGWWRPASARGSPQEGGVPAQSPRMNMGIKVRPQDERMSMGIEAVPGSSGGRMRLVSLTRTVYQLCVSGHRAP